MTLLPDIKENIRTMTLPSTGKKVKYRAMGTSIEKELGRIQATYREVFTNIAELIEDEDEARRQISLEIKDMTKQLIMTLQPCFPDLNLDTITEGDLEMIQIELKRRCVDDLLELNLKCPKCGNNNRASIDLNTIEIKDVEHEKNIVLDDGSILTIGHIPILKSISTITEKTTTEEMDFDNMVHSFKTLKIRKGRSFEEPINMEEMSYEDKVEWAFVRDNVKVEQRKQIQDFLIDQAPKIKPIVLEIGSCKAHLYDGKILQGATLTAMTERDALNQAEAMRQGETYVPEMSKVEKCGEKYSTTIYSIAEFMDFFS